MIKGKLFFIKSKANGLVLDIQDGCCQPGQSVVTWQQKDADYDNQLWYEEHITGTIRSKVDSNMCLQISDDNRLVVNPFEPEHPNQQWLTSGNRVMMRHDHQRVLDVVRLAGAADGGETEPWPPGSSVCAWACHAGPNQQWEFVYLPARFFYIRSKMHNKVLDVKGADPSPGTKVIMWDQKPTQEDNQLWYEDKHGVICSKLNGFVLDSSGKKTIRLAPFQPGDLDQMWTIYDQKIVNRVNPDRVLDIKGQETKNGAKLISFKWNGGENQRWLQEYVD
nr:ricin lectin domain-containing protein 6 [Arenicola marina]